MNSSDKSKVLRSEKRELVEQSRVNYKCLWSRFIKLCGVDDIEIQVQIEINNQVQLDSNKLM